MTSLFYYSQALHEIATRGELSAADRYRRSGPIRLVHDHFLRVRHHPTFARNSQSTTPRAGVCAADSPSSFPSIVTISVIRSLRNRFE
ncbi:hypothetical protein TIFTF001_003392 [Ficus carica]|uniref:Uncharacterized protein n=1 Tax=Ficus carica TaxID=3494 RepID=A0AA87Z7N8_FICCA|nr:hypothetical protein TIFTF001_003392 [Ficus carica]